MASALPTLLAAASSSNCRRCTLLLVGTKSMTAMGAKQTTPAAPTGKGHAARFASKKPQFKGVFMIMERDDSHYGPAGTVVAVSKREAQTQMLPRKLARYVPLDARGNPIWPESFLQRANDHAEKLKAAGGVTMTEEARLAAEREAKIKELEGVLAEEAAQLSALEGPLRFGRIPSTDSSVFFGSIGPVDVVEALRAKQIFVEEGSVEGEKVRTFGSHTFKVKLGLREATVDIFVEREEPGKESAAAQP